MIIEDNKQASAYSILADETADISGKEQLSIGVRFFDEKKTKIREEFLGFVELMAMNAETIASAIHQFIQNCGLDPMKCVGQGYDGCNTMAGRIGGVQKLLREYYPKALFFHCASHKLNLVVNDVNELAQVRNTTSTIKDIINFFRESVLRRKYVPNIPGFCETRWSQKYKSISVFRSNFETIITALEKLSNEGNEGTRKKAFQLHSAATKSAFIITVFIISKYSALLEPVVNALQSKNIDLIQCASHVKRITSIISEHRQNVDSEIEDLLNDVQVTAEKIDVELQIPRIVQRQTNRANHPSTNATEYWKRSLLIPYLDSLKSSLEDRFSDDNTPAYSLQSLHPLFMLKTSINDVKSRMNNFCQFYNLEHFDGEIELWFELWKGKKMNEEDLKNLDTVEVLEEANTFFPGIKTSLKILLALPCTTCTIERSFSTLRRVKTWTRSTMGEKLVISFITGLCLLSVHREMVNNDKEKIQEEVLNKFAADQRKLALS